MASWYAWKNRFCTALFLGVMSTQAAFAVPVLSVTATPSPTAPNSALAVNVLISGVADLYAYQYTLSFNAAVLQANSVTEGSFLTPGGPTFFDGGTIDNTAGKISFTFDSLVGNRPGVTGSGTLARVNFTGRSLGTSALTFSDVLLLDSALADIATQIQNGSVQSIPEPATLAMFCLGIGGLAALRQRKSAA